MKLIDTNNWNRKEHFDFFSKMTNPFFGITTEVDCTIAYEKAKKAGVSFFAYYFHKSILAANKVDELKYRIIEDKVYQFEVINAGATIGREDGTFAFIYVNFSTNFKTFNDELQKEIKLVKNSTGLRLNDDNFKQNLIRHTTIPWTSFTSILHPTNIDKTESIPKIVFGKFSIKEGKKMLPISIEANHSLLDGFHLAKYLQEFQNLLNE